MLTEAHKSDASVCRTDAGYMKPSAVSFPVSSLPKQSPMGLVRGGTNHRGLLLLVCRVITIRHWAK